MDCIAILGRTFSQLVGEQAEGYAADQSDIDIVFLQDGRLAYPVLDEPEWLTLSVWGPAQFSMVENLHFIRGTPQLVGMREPLGKFRPGLEVAGQCLWRDKIFPI